MTIVDSDKARRWVRESRRPVLQGIADAFLAVWHQRIRRFFGASFSVFGALLFFARLLFVFLIAATPIWAALISGNATIQDFAAWTAEATASVFLILLMVGTWLLDQISGRQKSEFDINVDLDIAITQASAFRGLQHHLKIRDNANSRANRQEAARGLLELIKKIAIRHLEKSPVNHFCVNLLIFKGDNAQYTELFVRTDRTRETASSRYNSEDLLCFYVAEHGSARSVLDLKSLPFVEYKSPSTGRIPSYRSILIVPLPLDNINGTDSCRGVITIDAARPYEFWGTADTDIATQINPILTLLNVLLSHNNEGIGKGGQNGRHYNG